MNWIESLERRFGHLAIPGLIRIVVAFNAAVFILYLGNPGILSFLQLDRDLILHGQVWRLFTYIFIPSLGRGWLMPDHLWLVFWLLFIWMLGDGLEQAWGSFKVNLFYLIGMIGTTIAALFLGAGFNGAMLNLSLLFAFATIFPDHSILIFFFLPVRIKWIAWVSFAGLCFAFLGSSWAARAAILTALANYLLFFGPMIVGMARHRQTVASRRLRFERNVKEAAADTMHSCAVCKKTEVTDPDLDFRVSRDGNEYCVEHLPARV